jgi:superfamily II DNA/RNA helicase
MFGQEKVAFKEGVDIIVSTPGRLISHLQQGYLQLDTLQHLILDEADRMLDMGFSDDIYKIISHIPHHPQTLLFSATMPPRIRELSKRILKDPEQINIALSKPAAGVTQGAYIVFDAQKMPLLVRILETKQLPSILIFSSTKEKVKQLELELKRKKFNVAAIHSDLDQPTRKSVLRSFAHRDTTILVATDILSRGIDVDEIGLVLNYDVPGDAEDYVHRVGRTARAASTGEAITFVGPSDQQKFGRIEQLIESEVPKLPVPEDLGEVPAYNPSRRQGDGHRHGGGNKKFHKRRPKK